MNNKSLILIISAILCVIVGGCKSKTAQTQGVAQNKIERNFDKRGSENAPSRRDEPKFANTSPVRGGSESAGGEITLSTTADEVIRCLDLILSEKITAKDFKVFLSVLFSGRYDSEFQSKAWVESVFFGENQVRSVAQINSLIQMIEGIKIERNLDNGCGTNENISVDASTSKGKVGAAICLNVERIRRFRTQELINGINGILIHEISHQYGADESTARAIQEDFNHFLKDRHLFDLDSCPFFEVRAEEFSTAVFPKFDNVFQLWTAIDGLPIHDQTLVEEMTTLGCKREEKNQIKVEVFNPDKNESWASYVPNPGVRLWDVFEPRLRWPVITKARTAWEKSRPWEPVLKSVSFAVRSCNVPEDLVPPDGLAVGYRLEDNHSIIGHIPNLDQRTLIEIRGELNTANVFLQKSNGPADKCDKLVSLLGTINMLSDLSSGGQIAHLVEVEHDVLNSVFPNFNNLAKEVREEVQLLKTITLPSLIMKTCGLHQNLDYSKFSVVSETKGQFASDFERILKMFDAAIELEAIHRFVYDPLD